MGFILTKTKIKLKIVSRKNLLKYLKLDHLEQCKNGLNKWINGPEKIAKQNLEYAGK